jgi:Winged helix DNA-binding domain
VRRYLRHLGPSSHSDLAAWAGIAPSHAMALIETVADELVRVDGRHLLAADREALESPPPARGVRLLGPGDPLLNARDREVLIADKEVRKRIWRPVGSPGVVLHDGRPAGAWRARKQGAKLRIETEWFGDPVDVREEAERLAALRDAELVYDV